MFCAPVKIFKNLEPRQPCRRFNFFAVRPDQNKQFALLWLFYLTDFGDEHSNILTHCTGGWKNLKYLSENQSNYDQCRLVQNLETSILLSGRTGGRQLEQNFCDRQGVLLSNCLIS